MPRATHPGEPAAIGCAGDRKDDAMNQLLVITFDAENEAQEALQALRKLEWAGEMRLADSAVVSKDPDGKVHAKNELSSQTETGGLVGGTIGVLLAGAFFPVIGTVIGVAAGALLGRSLHGGVDGKFVKEVEASMSPGTSALFLVFRKYDATALASWLQPYAGRVNQTTLSPELVEQLDRALREQA
jgi:uncharacterized membrane protein